MSEQLDYAMPRSDAQGRPVHLVIVLLVFVGLVALTGLILILVGNDRSPGSWNDIMVLAVFSPVANLLLASGFSASSFILRRRWGGPIILYIAFGVLVPFVGYLIVSQSVHH